MVNCPRCHAKDLHWTGNKFYCDMCGKPSSFNEAVLQKVIPEQQKLLYGENKK